MTDQTEGFISLREASEILKTSEKTLRKWISEGSLKAYRTPGKRFLLKKEDIQAVILQSAANIPVVSKSKSEVCKDEQEQ